MIIDLTQAGRTRPSEGDLAVWFALGDATQKRIELADSLITVARRLGYVADGTKNRVAE